MIVLYLFFNFRIGFSSVVHHAKSQARKIGAVIGRLQVAVGIMKNCQSELQTPIFQHLRAVKIQTYIKREQPMRTKIFVLGIGHSIIGMGIVGNPLRSPERQLKSLCRTPQIKIHKTVQTRITSQFFIAKIVIHKRYAKIGKAVMIQLILLEIIGFVPIDLKRKRHRCIKRIVGFCTGNIVTEIHCTRIHNRYRLLLCKADGKTKKQ